MANLSLKVDGMNVEMKNDLIDICFNKDGKSQSLKYQGKELLGNLAGEDGDPDKHNSFYCDYHVKGGTVNIHPNKLKVIDNTDNIIHISYIDNISDLGIEYHFMMKPDDSAIYSYVKAWNNSSKVFDINEFRTVYRLNHDLFYIGYNGERTGMQPTSAHMLKGKKLQDETFDMVDGSLYTNSSIYSKYDYAGFFKNTDLWGQYGKKYGFWFIPVDKSYYGCGPEAQDLMVHYDSITLNYMTSEHFGRDMFHVPVGWQKVYGPWCLYINDGNKEDALKRAKCEETKWPYSWVKDPNYKKNLATVTGHISSEYCTKRYMVVLADDIHKVGPIIQQKNGYTYYAETNSSNEFTINNVRPGDYYLYAYGILGDDFGTHLLKKVTIKNNQNLGTFKISKAEKIIWQIGKASHNTSGFKFSNQLRNYCWENLIPENLDYTVGQSTDWYYLQNNKGNWKIHFESSEQYKDNLILKLSFAGVTQKKMTDHGGTRVSIFLNGEQLGEKYFNNDRAAYRSAMKGGAYHYWKIPIAKNSLFSDKENIITINTDGYIMYDSICMSQKKA